MSYLRPRARQHKAAIWPVALNEESALARGLVFYVPYFALPAGLHYDLVRGIEGTPEANVSPAAMGRSDTWYDGYAAESTASGTSSQVAFAGGDPGELTAITILARYGKVDTTARGTSAFGCTNTSNPQRINCHLPWSDGNIYWDFGYTTSYNRLSVGGLSWSPDDAFAFVCENGTTNGQEIWQNGTRRAQGTPAAGTRAADTGDFLLFGYAANSSDLARFQEFAIFDRRLTDAEIQEWTWGEPQLVHELGRRTWFIPAAAAAAYTSRLALLGVG